MLCSRVLREAQRLEAGMPAAAGYDYILQNNEKATERMEFGEAAHETRLDLKQPRA